MPEPVCNCNCSHAYAEHGDTHPASYTHPNPIACRHAVPTPDSKSDAKPIAVTNANLDAEWRAVSGVIADGDQRDT